jgi:ribonuclease HII
VWGVFWSELPLAVIAGIDEAGFGPLLGPLVVSTAAIAVPEESVAADLWDLLGGTVTRKPRKRAGSLAIGDSKELFHRQHAKALEHLERGVLAMLATRDAHPRSLRELLALLAPGAVGALEEYPWYAGSDLPLPHCLSATDVALAGNALAAAMGKADMRLETIRAEVVDVGEYNRTVAATHNKSVTLFDVTSRLLVFLWQRLWHHAQPGSVRIHADHQGGRIRYRPGLQRVFADCEFKILDETDTLSGYRMSDLPASHQAGRGQTGSARSAELFFSVESDRHHLPVALASMVCKYIRELLMELFNRFWARHVPGLAATAGYYTDGKRFLADIAAAIEALGVPRDLLERSR